MWFIRGLRLFLAWLAATAIAVLAGKQLIGPFIAVISAIVELLQPDKTVVLRLIAGNDTDAVEFRTFLLEPLHLAGAIYLRPHSWLPVSSVEVSHILVPAVIIWAIVVAWWPSSIRQRLAALVGAIFLSVGLSVILAALLLAGKIDILVAEAGLRVHLQMPETLMIWATIVLEVGGNILLAVLSGLFCVWLAKHIDRPAARQMSAYYAEPFRG